MSSRIPSRNRACTAGNHACSLKRKLCWNFDDISDCTRSCPLQWCHNELDSVSIVYSIVCSGADQRKQKLRVTGLCERNSPVTGEFPSQRASNAENVSIWWRHHAKLQLLANDSQWQSKLHQNDFRFRVDTIILFFKLSQVRYQWFNLLGDGSSRIMTSSRHKQLRSIAKSFYQSVFEHSCRDSFYLFYFLRIIEILSTYQIQCSSVIINVVNFLGNPLKRHRIARPWGLAPWTPWQWADNSRSFQCLKSWTLTMQDLN